jgi:hypothetical protein
MTDRAVRPSSMSRSPACASTSIRLPNQNAGPQSIDFREPGRRTSGTAVGHASRQSRCTSWGIRNRVPGSPRSTKPFMLMAWPASSELYAVTRALASPSKGSRRRSVRCGVGKQSPASSCWPKDTPYKYRICKVGGAMGEGVVTGTSGLDECKLLQT